MRISTFITCAAVLYALSAPKAAVGQEETSNCSEDEIARQLNEGQQRADLARNLFGQNRYNGASAVGGASVKRYRDVAQCYASSSQCEQARTAASSAAESAQISDDATAAAPSQTAARLSAKRANRYSRQAAEFAAECDDGESDEEAPETPEQDEDEVVSDSGSDNDRDDQEDSDDDTEGTDSCNGRDTTTLLNEGQERRDLARDLLGQARYNGAASVAAASVKRYRLAAQCFASSSNCDEARAAARSAGASSRVASDSAAAARAFNPSQSASSISAKIARRFSGEAFDFAQGCDN